MHPNGSEILWPEAGFRYSPRSKGKRLELLGKVQWLRGLFCPLHPSFQFKTQLSHIQDQEHPKRKQLLFVKIIMISSLLTSLAKS
jgi:hypothetical protein